MRLDARDCGVEPGFDLELFFVGVGVEQDGRGHCCAFEQSEVSINGISAAADWDKPVMAIFPASILKSVT